MKIFKKLLAATGLAVAVGSANAGVPVIDAANLVQSIQQVLAWSQQFDQMVQQIRTMENQYAQLQNTYNSFTGGRGLGTILNTVVDQAARRYLPDAADDVDALASGAVPRYAALQSTIAGFKTAVTSTNSTTFGTGTTAANTLIAKINSLATQKALGQAAYTSAAQRTTDLENMISTIGVADDPKAIAEMQARIGAQQALVANENAKVQSMAYMQAYEQQQNEQRANETVGHWGKDDLPPVTF